MDWCTVLRTAKRPNKMRTKKRTLNFEKYRFLAASGRVISMD